MIYEMRIYRLREGTKKTFLRGFKKATGIMGKYGMTFVTAWENTERPDEFIWVRSFANAGEREKSMEGFYGGPEWARISAAIRAGCDGVWPVRRREVRIMKPQSYSPLK